MSHSRGKSKGKPGASGGEGAGPAPAAAARQSAAARGPHFAEGPMIGLGGGGAGVQRKPVLGQPGDRYEQEAESVAQRVTSGLDAPAISSIAPGSMGGGAQRWAVQRAMDEGEDEVQSAAAPEKKPEEKPVQKAEDEEPVQKAEEDEPVQAAAAEPAKKPEDKPVQKAEDEGEGEAEAVQAAAAEKKPDDKPVQKAEEEPEPEAIQAAAEPAKKPEEKPVQKAEDEPETEAIQAAAEKKPEEKPVQKAAASPVEEMLKGPPSEKPRTVGPEKDREKAALQKAEAPEKKPPEKPVQKAEPAKKPEEKAVQKDAKDTKDGKDEKAKPVQKAEAPKDEKKPVQKAGGDKDEEPVQADTAGAGGGGGAPAAPAPSMANAAEQAISGKGGGEPLNTGTRSVLEDRLGSDLSGVRVHSDSSAQKSAEDLNARAFTHGQDIWLASGESQNDLGLMAHEATHVVQQSGAVQRQVVQRAKGKSKNKSTDPDEYIGPEGTINRRTQKASIPEMKVPTFKKKFTKTPFDLPQKTDDKRPDDQRAVWEKVAKEGPGLESKLKTKLTKEKSPRATQQGQPIHFLKLKGDKNYVIGDKEAIRQRALRPFWGKDGQRKFHDVDHQLELQLGGPHEIGNMWLLESGPNQESGRQIRVERNARIQKLIDAATGPVWTRKPPTAEAVRRSYTIKVESVVGGLAPKGTPETWTLPQIQAGEQIDVLSALTKKQIEAAGLEGDPDKLAIYTSETGGGVRFIDWGKKVTSKKVSLPFGKNFRINQVDYSKSKGGSLSGTAFKDNKIIEQVALSFPIQESDAVDWGGFVPQSAVTRAVSKVLKAKGLSPITIDNAELDPEKGIIARGKLRPSIPLFSKNVEIDIVIEGDDVYLSKTFDIGDYSFPGPIKVTDASLTVNAGTRGFEVLGDVFFDVEKLGHGSLHGLGSTSKGFGLKGKLELESDLFSPAEFEVWYRDEKFGGKGKLGVKSGKLKGVKSATVEVLIDGDLWEAKGAVEPDMRGIEKASLEVKYNPAVGIEAMGNLQLASDIPLVKGGSVEASMKPREGGTDYVVKAHGNAIIGFHGLTANIDVDYDDGAFTVHGTVPFEKGMLKGNITLGATNRAVGDDGQPSGPPTETITPFGSGIATIKIAPWLQGTAGIKLLPNGEIEVSGKIALPSALDVFPEKKVNKRIFEIGIDIPLVGVSVLGKRIGIFATVGGGLDAKAGIGPGQLRDLSLEITYNPSHEEETKVTGRALFHVPASAGLRLFIKGGVGAGIPVVSAEAGLEVGAALGVEGAAQAEVTVEWSPAKGLSLDAEAKVYAEPKFTFDITAYLKVKADLLIKTVTLVNKRKNLASFQYGSGLRFGITFPIHYREGQPFDVSLSDVQFEVPDIDPLDMLSGLVKRIL